MFKWIAKRNFKKFVCEMEKRCNEERSYIFQSYDSLNLQPDSYEYLVQTNGEEAFFQKNGAVVERYINELSEVVIASILEIDTAEQKVGREFVLETLDFDSYWVSPDHPITASIYVAGFNCKKVAGLQVLMWFLEVVRNPYGEKEMHKRAETVMGSEGYQVAVYLGKSYKLCKDYKERAIANSN